jgi:hypothetical protein
MVFVSRLFGLGTSLLVLSTSFSFGIKSGIGRRQSQSCSPACSFRSRSNLESSSLIDFIFLPPPRHFR